MPPEIPPHPLLRPVPPAALEGRTCAICHHGFDGRQFVESLVPDHAEPPIAPGLTITKDNEPGRTVYRHRDPWAPGGQSITTEVRAIYCGECITAAAQQLGLPPATDVVLNAEREARERAETAERERDEAQRELEELHRAHGVVQGLTKLLETEKASKTTRRKAAA